MRVLSSVLKGQDLLVAMKLAASPDEWRTLFLGGAVAKWLSASTHFEYAVEGYLGGDADRIDLVLARFRELTLV